LTQPGGEPTLEERAALSIQRVNVINRDESTVGPRLPPRQGRASEPEDAVRDQFRRARRAGHPAWLWPEIPVSHWREALRTLEAIARSVLTSARPEPIRAPDPAAERALGLASYTSGLGPWLGWNIERGVLDADDRSARLLHEHLDHARRRWAQLERELADVLTAFSERGIEATVLKGACGAQRWFAEPALRPMADVDVLVSHDEQSRSAHALRELGYDEQVEGRSVHPPRTEWRRRGSPVLPRSLMLVHADDPVAIDLHASLDIDFFGVATVRFDALGRALVDVMQMGDTTLRVLKQPLLAAHHAVHASHGLHGLTLVRLVELSLMLRHDMKCAADQDALDSLLSDLRAERFAWPALALAEQLAPGTVSPALLKRCADASPARLRRVVAGMSPATAQRLDGLALQERFMWSSGFNEHVRRAANMLLPTGRGGPVRRLGRIYLERTYRLLRLRVGWSAERN
jgi:hypothetical protein